MPSYNEVDGIPSHSNKHLLLDILRGEWGFQGLVASDYFGPTELRTVHHIVATEDEAARLAFDSGVDVELPFNQAYGSWSSKSRREKWRKRRRPLRDSCFARQIHGWPFR